MNRLTLPGGVAICQIGFGCARLYAGADLKASAKLIETALDCGIRHFDTAPSYGAGASEEALGAVLSGVADVTIATKVGMRVIATGQSPAGSLYRRTVRPLLAMAPGLKAALLAARAHMRRAASPPPPPPTRRPILPDEIHASLEASLKRLRRTRADLLLLHEPDHLDWGPETVAALDALKASRAIGGYGLAFGGASDGRSLGDVTQLAYNPKDAPPPAAGVRLYHSVLRVPAGRSVSHSASDKLAAALRIGPHVGVVFSASSAQQIHEIMNGSAAIAAGARPVST